MCVCCVCLRERERERERQTDRQTDRQTGTQTHRDREGESYCNTCFSAKISGCWLAVCGSDPLNNAKSHALSVKKQTLTSVFLTFRAIQFLIEGGEETPSLADQLTVFSYSLVTIGTAQQYDEIFLHHRGSTHCCHTRQLPGNDREVIPERACIGYPTAATLSQHPHSPEPRTALGG